MRLKLSCALATAAWVCATCACACCSCACACATCASALLQLRLGLLHLRLGLLDFGGQRAFQQLRLRRRLLRVGARLRDGVAGGALVGAQLVLIEHGDQVAGLHALPVVHGQVHDAAGDLAAHHHFVAVHGAGEHQRLRAWTLVPPDRAQRWRPGRLAE